MKAVPLRSSLLALVAALLVSPSVVRVEAQRRPPAQTPVRLVFVVGGEAGSREVSLDALAVVAGGRLRAPYAEQETDPAQKFAAEHMRAGQKYRLTFGGGDAGTVTISESGEGCNNVHAKGTAETSVTLGGRVMALATDAESFGRPAPARRAPTPAEREAALRLARETYRARRTPAALLASMGVRNLTATDIDGDGRFELVGSFEVVRGQARRDLFLVAAPGARGFRADFVHFQSYRTPPEGYVYASDFVDQLDLDGDGTGEVVTMDGGFDGYGYTVYQKKRGRWRRVHGFIGDAC